MNAAIKIGGGMESTYIRVTCSLLAAWAQNRHRESGEVKGYPPEVPFYRLIRGSSVGGLPITDEQYDRVDAAVSKLCHRCPDQGEALKLSYLDHMPNKKIGERLDVGETRARELVRQAENAVDWILECGQ